MCFLGGQDLPAFVCIRLVYLSPYCTISSRNTADLGAACCASSHKLGSYLFRDRTGEQSSQRWELQLPSQPDPLGRELLETGQRALVQPSAPLVSRWPRLCHLLKREERFSPATLQPSGASSKATAANVSACNEVGTDTPVNPADRGEQKMLAELFSPHPEQMAPD